MSKYRVLTLAAASMLILIVGTHSILAQNDCGDGLPCGRIPWSLPFFPTLLSPTPMPTVAVTTVPPTVTPGGATATPTGTPAPTSAPFSVDLDGINDQFSTLQAAIDATQPVLEVSGTPVDTNQQIDDLASNSYTFFGYVRGVASLDLGGFTPFLTFIISSVLVVIAVKSITFILPILFALYNFIKGVVDTVLSLIP